MKLKIFNYSIGLMILTILLTSCTSQCHLCYEPIQYDPIRPELMAVKKNKPLFAISVQTFEDLRPRNCIGVFRTDLGLTLHNVTSKNNISEWARQALITELNHAGYEISTSTEKPKKYEIQGKVLKTFALGVKHSDYHSNTKGTVKIELTVKNDNGIIFSKIYKRTKNKNFWNNDIPNELIRKNLQDIYREFLNDFQRCCS